MMERPCEWDEPLERYEITHQLEPGEKRPTRKLSGTVFHVAPLQEVYPSGRGEVFHYAYIISDKTGAIVVKKLPEIRMTRCSTSTVPSVPPSQGFSGL